MKSSSRSGSSCEWSPVALAPKETTIGRPMLGLDYPGLGYRIEDFVATGLLVVGHLGFAIGRPTPSKGHREHEVVEKLLQVAHRDVVEGQPTNQRTPRPVRRVWPRPPVPPSTVARGHRGLKSMTEEPVGVRPHKWECLAVQGVQIVKVHRRMLAVVMTIDSFELSDAIFFARSKFTLAHHVERCAAAHNKLSIFFKQFDRDATNLS